MSNWISVKDRLPEPGQRVIVFSAKGKFIGEGWMDAKRKWFRYDGFASVELLFGTVTHWQPFPEPPEVRE